MNSARRAQRFLYPPNLDPLTLIASSQGIVKNMNNNKRSCNQRLG